MYSMNNSWTNHRQEAIGTWIEHVQFKINIDNKGQNSGLLKGILQNLDHGLSSWWPLPINCCIVNIVWLCRPRPINSLSVTGSHTSVESLRGTGVRADKPLLQIFQVEFMPSLEPITYMLCYPSELHWAATKAMLSLSSPDGMYHHHSQLVGYDLPSALYNPCYDGYWGCFSHSKSINFTDYHEVESLGQG